MADVLPEEQYSKGLFDKVFQVWALPLAQSYPYSSFKRYIPASAGNFPIGSMRSFFLGHSAARYGSVIWSCPRTSRIPAYLLKKMELWKSENKRNATSGNSVFFFRFTDYAFAYLILLILLILQFVDRKIIRKRFIWAETPGLQILFCQNLEIIEAISRCECDVAKLALLY